MYDRAVQIHDERASAANQDLVSSRCVRDQATLPRNVKLFGLNSLARAVVSPVEIEGRVNAVDLLLFFFQRSPLK